MRRCAREEEEEEEEEGRWYTWGYDDWRDGVVQGTMSNADKGVAKSLQGKRSTRHGVALTSTLLPRCPRSSPRLHHGRTQGTGHDRRPRPWPTRGRTRPVPTASPEPRTPVAACARQDVGHGDGVLGGGDEGGGPTRRGRPAAGGGSVKGQRAGLVGGCGARGDGGEGGAGGPGVAPARRTQLTESTDTQRRSSSSRQMVSALHVLMPLSPKPLSVTSIALHKESRQQQCCVPPHMCAETNNQTPAQLTAVVAVRVHKRVRPT